MCSAYRQKLGARFFCVFVEGGKKIKKDDQSQLCAPDAGGVVLVFITAMLEYTRLIRTTLNMTCYFVIVGHNDSPLFELDVKDAGKVSSR